MFLKKKQKRAAQLSLSLWNLKLLALIGAKTTKISCTKAHIYPREKVEFSEQGKRRCSLALRTTYYRKSGNFNCSCTQFVWLQKCSLLGKNEHLLRQITFQWQLIALLSRANFYVIICEYSIVRSWIY